MLPQSQYTTIAMSEQTKDEITMQQNNDMNKLIRNVDINVHNEAQKLTNIYEYHPHIIQLIIIGLMMQREQNVVLPLTSLVLFWCIIIIIIAIYLRHKSSKHHNTNIPLSHYINTVLGIANKANIKQAESNSDNYNIYSINRQYHGIIMLLIFIHRSIMIFIYYSTYYVPGYVTTANSNSISRGLLISGWICLAASITMVATAYFEISTKAQKDIENMEKQLIQKYSHCNSIQVISDRLSGKVEDWRDSKFIKKRKAELVVVLLGVTIVRILWALLNFINDNSNGDVKDKYIAVGVYVFYIWIMITDIVAITFVVFEIWHKLFYHFKLAAIIMNEFGLPIDCQSIDDLFAWWELKNYYKYYVIKVYSTGFSATIFAILILTSILVFFLFQSISQGEFLQIWIGYVISLCYTGLLTFIGVTIASQYHEKQLSHSITINKEKLRFKKIHYMNTMTNEIKNSNINNLQMNIINETIDVISDDIKNNSQSIKCFGVALNYNFILFLRASVISIIIAFISIQGKQK